MGTEAGTRLDEEGVTYCARHPQIETALRCSRCDTPICPRCLVQTPVGARCRDCANLRRLPTLDVSPVYFARAMTAALISGLVVGAFLAFFIGGFAFLGWFSIFIGLGVGWAISESVSLAANRKRGLGLQVCAVLGVLLAFLVQEFLNPGPKVGPGAAIGVYQLISAGIGAFFAASRLRIG